MLRTHVMVILVLLVIGCKGGEEKFEPPIGPKLGSATEPPEFSIEPQPESGIEPPPQPGVEPESELEPGMELAQVEPVVVVVDRGIEAAGGLAAVTARFSAYTLRSRGLYLGSPYEMTTVWKAPDRMYMTIDSGAFQMGYGADSCWIAVNGVVMDCPPDEAAGVPAQLMVANLMGLYPLKGEGVVLSLLPEGKVNREVTDRIEVKVPGGPVPVRMDFDRKTGILLRSEYQGAFGGSKGSVVHEILRYQDQDGVKVPKKSTLVVGGAPFIKDTLEEITWEVDEGVFKRPAQRAMETPTVRTVKTHTVAHVIHKGHYEGLGEAMGGLMAWVEEAGLKVVGGPSFVYIVCPQKAADSKDYVTEIRVPVTAPGDLHVEHETYAIKQVEETLIAVRLEQGTYEKAGSAFGPLAAWCVENGYEMTGLPSMNSYSDPTRTPQDDLLNEVYYSVRKKDLEPNGP